VGSVVLFLLVFLCLKAEVFAAFTTQGINYWSAPDHTRIVLPLLRESRPEVVYLSHPSRIVIKFKSPIRGRIKTTTKVKDSLVDRIVVSRRGNRNTVTIFLKGKFNYRVFTLRKFRNRPFRIVVDVLKPRSLVEKQRKERIMKAAQYKLKRKYIVVLDPGHGGSDPGAIGNGIYEKKIVLDLARRVARYLKRDPKFGVFLTRGGDYYVPLRKRVEIAHDYNADIFVSIHTNSAPVKSLNGIMAFVLSERGARSSLARMLENIENTEEMVKDIKLAKSRRTNKVVLDVAHDFSVVEGERLGRYILEYTSSLCGFTNRGIRKASLVVLKNPGIPSILLEVGFLSNKKDAARLKNPSFREKIAYSIYRGIKAYLESKKEIIAMGKRIHLVKRGETLWKIARIYGVTIEEIRRYNRLKSSMLKPGMKLAIP